MARRAAPFWSRVARVAGAGCWEWTGGKSGGYGTVRAGGRSAKAHRVAWELTFGAPAEGLCVLHRCDNPGCVRPDHLFLGTLDDNNKDRAAKGRSRGTFDSSDAHPAKLRRGERHWRALLTAADVVEIRRRSDLGERRIDIAARYSVNPATISRIARRIWRQEVP